MFWIIFYIFFVLLSPKIIDVSFFNGKIFKNKMLYDISLLLIGHGVITSLLFLLNVLFGIKIFFSLGFLILIIICSLIYYISNIYRGKKGVESAEVLSQESQHIPPQTKLYRWSFILLSLVAVAYFGELLVCNLSDGCNDWSSFGVWGLKGKIIYHTRSVFPVFTNPEIDYSHLDYPLGFPILLSFIHEMSGFNSYEIKIVPLFFGVISFITIYQIGKELLKSPIVALIVALFIATMGSFRQCCSHLYVDMMLVPMVLLGVYYLLLFLRGKKDELEKKSANLLLGMTMILLTCWYKNEGLLYSVVIGLAVLIFGYKDIVIVLKDKKSFRKVVYGLLIAMFLFVLPWQITKYKFQLKSRDFVAVNSLSDIKKQFIPFPKHEFAQITTSFLTQSYNKIYRYPWEEKEQKALLKRYESVYNFLVPYGLLLGVVLIILGGLFIIRKTTFSCMDWMLRYRELFFTLFIIFGVVLAFYSCFFFSAVPLRWHLGAVGRILLIPKILFYFLVMMVIGEEKKVL